MKIAVVSPAPGATLVDKLGWVAEGFREAGFDVRRCHSLPDVRRADAEVDLIVFDQKGFPDRAALVGMAATKRAIWCEWWRDLIAAAPALPLKSQNFMRSGLSLMRAMDMVFVKERGLLQGFAEIGVNARYLDQAAPSQMPACEYREKPEFDVLVLGIPYQQRRRDAMALVEAGFSVLWAGLPCDWMPQSIQQHPWVHPLKLPELISRCGVVLGVDARCDVPGYTSDRTYMAAGIGAAYIVRSIDYGIDCAVPTSAASELASWLYFDSGSLVSAVREALADRGERERRGMAARERVLAKHTYKHRAAELVCIIQREFSTCGVS